MNHPDEDALLLMAYGELPAEQVTELESHVAACEPCRATFAQYERTRVALDDAMPTTPRRRARPDWTAIVLGAAAVLAAVMITRPRPAPDATAHWAPTTTWSMTAGYVTGGTAMKDIDAQLTQLERDGGRYHGQPD
jgi:anti-sigma factor RsiW